MTPSNNSKKPTDTTSPVFKAKNIAHKIPGSRKSTSSKEKVNVILMNAIGPKPEMKKVRIPKNAPIQLLKEKIAELYNLDTQDFKLSHIRNKGPNTPDKITVSPKDVKTAVRIILRDRNGQKKFQQKVRIPDEITIGDLQKQIAKKFGSNTEDFHLSVEKYIN